MRNAYRGCRPDMAREDLVVLSPYLTARIQRFGVRATDEITLTPDPFDTRLTLALATAS
jgi:hypothetical protein